MSTSTSDLSATNSRRLCLTVNNVEWQNPAVTAVLYGTAYLFDTMSHERVTESYRFSTAKGDDSLKQPAHFEVTNAHAGIVLIVRLEKQLEGDVGTWVEQYTKGKPANNEEIRTGHRQPFGWAYSSIFDDQLLGDDSSADVDGDSKKELAMDWFIRYDENHNGDGDIAASIENARSKNPKKLKTIPVKLGITIAEEQAAAVDLHQDGHHFGGGMHYFVVVLRAV